MSLVKRRDLRAAKVIISYFLNMFKIKRMVLKAIGIIRPMRKLITRWFHVDKEYHLAKFLPIVSLL